MSFGRLELFTNDFNRDDLLRASVRLPGVGRTTHHERFRTTTRRAMTTAAAAAATTEEVAVRNRA